MSETGGSGSAPAQSLTDRFELFVALLLGAAAIGAALATYQESLWGGKSVEAYGESSVMSTAANSTFSDELTTYMTDSQVDIEAKKAIWTGLETSDEVEAERSFELASYLYLYRLSDVAYAELGLPATVRHSADAGEADALISPSDLEAALEVDLEESYDEEVFSASAEEFDDADVKFAEGRKANATGDGFSLASVIFSISLFFAGLTLVFKSRMRWVCLISGAVIFALGCLALALKPWTS
ncbi:MAG: hypothetical protein V9F00_11965 [Nocardioides sp.]